MSMPRGGLSIRSKLQVAFLALGALVGVVGFLATARIQHIGAALQAIHELNTEAQRQGRLRTSLLLQVEAEKNFLLSGDPKYLEIHAKLRRENETVIAAALGRLKVLQLSPRFVDLVTATVPPTQMLFALLGSTTKGLMNSAELSLDLICCRAVTTSCVTS